MALQTYLLTYLLTCVVREASRPSAFQPHLEGEIAGEAGPAAVQASTSSFAQPIRSPTQTIMSPGTRVGPSCRNGGRSGDGGGSKEDSTAALGVHPASAWPKHIQASSRACPAQASTRRAWTARHLSVSAAGDAQTVNANREIEGVSPREQATALAITAPIYSNYSDSYIPQCVLKFMDPNYNLPSYFEGHRKNL